MRWWLSRVFLKRWQVAQSSQFLRTSLLSIMAATTIACSGIAAKATVVAGTKPRNVLKAAPCAQREWAQKTVSNGIKTRQMLVWQPFNNKYVAWRGCRMP